MTFELGTFYVFLDLDQEATYDACDTMSQIQVKFLRRTRKNGLQHFGPFDARITSVAVQDDDAICEIEAFFDDLDELPSELQVLRLGFGAKVRFDGLNTPSGEAYPLW